MAKISKQTKLKVTLEYLSGNESQRVVVKRYGIHYMTFRMLLAANEINGVDVLFNPLKSFGLFRVNLVSWTIKNNASKAEIAAKFGYVEVGKISQWKEIYSRFEANGLLSIQTGRPFKMTNKKPKKVKQITEEEWFAQLEDENLRLKIENEALKLLASIQQRIDNSQR